MVIGRGGSMLLHSLFDNHPSILAYPGILNFYLDIWPAILKNPEDSSTIIETKLVSWVKEMEPYNIGQYLGDKFDQQITIDCKRISRVTVELLNNKFTNSKKTFLAIQFSIAQQFKTDIENIKVIYCHEHTSEPDDSLIENIVNDWPSCKILCMLRDPRSNFIAIRNWEEKRIENKMHADDGHRYIPGMYAQLCYFWYTRLLRVALKFPKYFVLIRLEDFQRERITMLKHLCDLISIPYVDSLLQTSFGGMTWHGDNFSPKQAGIRNSADPKKWQATLSSFRKGVFEIVLKNEIACLSYPFLYKNNFLIHLYVYLLFPFWFVQDWKRIFESGYYTYMHQKGFGRLKALMIAIKSIIGLHIEVNNKSAGRIHEQDVAKLFFLS